MTCKEKILSEEYYDLITDYLFTEEFKESGVPDYCYTKIDDKYGLVYVKKDEVIKYRETMTNMEKELIDYY